MTPSRRPCTSPPSRRSCTASLPSVSALRDDPARQGSGLRRDHEDRSYPPHGRGSAHPGPGVLGLRRPTDGRHLAGRGHPPGPLRAGSRRYGGRARLLTPEFRPAVWPRPCRPRTRTSARHRPAIRRPGAPTTCKVFTHGALRTLAVSFAEIADDLRWLGQAEIRPWKVNSDPPENEPGSSVYQARSADQVEAMITQVGIQVLGNTSTAGHRRQPGQPRAQRLRRSSSTT